jgi:ketosteroid isomerase-like protein
VSEESIAVVRRLVEAFNSGDVDTMLDELDPEAELYPMRAQLEGTVYRGHDGLRQWLSDLDEDWEWVRMDADEFREVDDAVVALGRLRSRGRASGVDLDLPLAVVWKLRGGKVVYSKAYSERHDAVTSAGGE